MACSDNRRLVLPWLLQNAHAIQMPTNTYTILFNTTTVCLCKSFISLAQVVKKINGHVSKLSEQPSYSHVR